MSSFCFFLCVVEGMMSKKFSVPCVIGIGIYLVVIYYSCAFLSFYFFCLPVPLFVIINFYGNNLRLGNKN
jgi:hypothetical protein